MKKHHLLASLLCCLSLLFLTACGPKNDNGTYVYKVDASKIMSRYDKGEAELTATLDITDDQGSISVSLTEDGDEVRHEDVELTINQKEKTMTENSGGNTTTYKIMGNTIIIESDDPEFLKDAKFIKQ